MTANPSNSDAIEQVRPPLGAFGAPNMKPAGQPPTPPPPSHCASCLLCAARALQYLLFAPMQSYHAPAASDPRTTPSGTAREAPALQTTLGFAASHGDNVLRQAAARPSPVPLQAVPGSLTSASLPAALSGSRKVHHSSSTWTASSGEPAPFDETEQTEDRAVFVQEYNRLAKKVLLPREISQVSAVPVLTVVAAWGSAFYCRRTTRRLPYVPLVLLPNTLDHVRGR